MHSLRVVWVFPLILCVVAFAGCGRDRSGGGLGINPRTFIDAGSASCAEACANIRRLADHPSCSDISFEAPPDCEAQCEGEDVDAATLACVANAADCGAFLMCVEGGTGCTCDDTSSCDEGCSCDDDCSVPPPPLDAGTGVDAGSGFLCSDDCPAANDGECDDGGEGSITSVCEFGTDCSDCGARFAE